MWQDAHSTYLESRVLAADPMELVRMLFQACTAAVRDARRHLAEGEIGERSRAITKAWEILQELTCSLDVERGGELSTRLGQLYDYMQHRLLEANLKQADAPLAEVLGLLATLAEGWNGAVSAAKPPVPEPGVWAQPNADEPAGASAHGWSL